MLGEAHNTGTVYRECVAFALTKFRGLAILVSCGWSGIGTEEGFVSMTLVPNVARDQGSADTKWAAPALCDGCGARRTPQWLQAFADIVEAGRP